jgi:anti-sigma regulatory factor (Ser/Thr protein kinase)
MSQESQDLPDSQESPTTFWSFEHNPDVLQVHRAEFPGIRDSLHAIRELAVTAATSSSLEEMAVAEFEMAMDELCANIIEHGYEQQDAIDCQHNACDILVEIGCFHNHIEAIITDYSAIRFPVASAPRPGLASFLQDTRTRGLGLDIVRHCVDDVEHHWLHPQGNQTRLVKFYATPQDPPAQGQ